MFLRRFLHILIVITVCFSFTSCQKDEENKRISRSQETLTLAEEYPNLPVGLHTIFTQYNQGCMVIVRFPKEVKSVMFGANIEAIKESSIKPSGCFWSDFSSDLVIYENGFRNFVVIGKPKDGSEQIIYESRPDSKNQECKLLYDPHNLKEQTIRLELTGYEEFHKAQIDINGQLFDFTKEDINLWVSTS